MSPMLLSIVVFAAVSAMVAAAIFAFKDFGGKHAEDRLDVLAGLKTPELEARGLLKEEVLREGVDGFTGAISRMTGRMGSFKNLFIQADSPISINAFFGVSAGCGLMGMVGAMIARSPVPLYPVAGLLFGSFPL